MAETLWQRIGAVLVPRSAAPTPADAEAFRLANMADATGLTPEQFAQLFRAETFAGAVVTPETAMRAIPVQACAALIAGGIVSMPLQIVARTLDRGQYVREPADDHPYWWLFNEAPNDDMTSAEFWQRVVIAMLLYGEAFARIVRAASGKSNQVAELAFHENRDVQVMREWDPVARRNRIVRYVVQSEGRYFGVAPDDMLHFRGKVGIGAPTRSSILESAREAIGITLAIQEYVGRVFTSGGTSRIAIQYPQGVKVGDSLRDQIRASWPRLFGGGSNSHIPFIVGGGGTVQKISWTSEELQMLESRRFQVIEIARAFGVQPFLIGESEKTGTWGSGIDAMGQGFVRFSLWPHMTPIEQEVTRKLFRTSRYIVDFDEDALSRGDMKALGDWFRQAVGGSQGPGFVMINEVRRRLNLPPVPGGNTLYDPKGASNASQPTEPAAGAVPTEPGQAAAV